MLLERAMARRAEHSKALRDVTMMNRSTSIGERGDNVE